MKASELRIGNLVRIENELLLETKGEIYLVSGIASVTEPIKQVMFPNSKYAICLEHTKSLRTYNQFEEFIKPIPLTEELLLKCGFKKGQYEYVLGDFIMEWFHNGYNFTGGEGCQMGVPILYLHQLQNLYFALTGEELIIKL